MINALSLSGNMTAIRDQNNKYLPLNKDDININLIYEILKTVIIPTTNDMVLMEIFDDIYKFHKLNEPLKGAW